MTLREYITKAGKIQVVKNGNSHNYPIGSFLAVTLDDFSDSELDTDLARTEEINAIRVSDLTKADGTTGNNIMLKDCLLIRSTGEFYREAIQGEMDKIKELQLSIEALEFQNSISKESELFPTKEECVYQASIQDKRHLLRYFLNQ